MITRFTTSTISEQKKYIDFAADASYVVSKHAEHDDDDDRRDDVRHDSEHSGGS